MFVVKLKYNSFDVSDDDVLGLGAVGGLGRTIGLFRRSVCAAVWGLEIYGLRIGTIQ